MIIDILVIAVLLISALIAFLRGFIRETLTIAGVVGGLAAAYMMGPFVTPFMRGWLGVDGGTDAVEAGEAASEAPEKLFGILPYDVLADILSYGLVFIVVVILLSILSHFLAESVRSIGLGAVDRTLGFIFGLVRGVLLIGLLYLPVYFFVDNETKEEWFKTSRTQFYLEKVAESIASYIPNSAVEDAESKIEEINEADKTRRRLEEINVLKTRNGTIEKSREIVIEEDPHGYDDEFREQIDQLFEQENPAGTTGEGTD